MADNPYNSAYDQQEIARLNTIFATHKAQHQTAAIPSSAQRIANIKRLKNAVITHQQALITAMQNDFAHRSPDDSLLGDIMTTVMNANYTAKNIKRWMKPSKRHINVLFQPASGQVHYQPLGVVGIITPWNYPVFLALGPLISALAAGNTAIIKMSEFTPATNEVMRKLIKTAFKPEQVSVICGGASVASHFSALDFDHIVFTGSTQIGKKVMASAAANLTPVTLELGGKSPVIIDETINIDTAVKRFLMAKTINSGQTCVSPDYVLCPKDKIPDLLTALKSQFNAMYPGFAANPDYSSIITDAQYQRLISLIDDSNNKGATITPLCAVNANQTQRKMPLTVITNVNDEMTVMQQEIFGPLLPVIGYSTLDEAINYVNARPRPLALYIMSFNKQVQNKLLTSTQSGGVCINDAAMHVAQDDLPFGGVGDSGLGHYHGYEGFLTLSKAKAVFKRGKLSFGSLIFPPYNTRIHRLIYKLFIR